MLTSSNGEESSGFFYYFIRFTVYCDSRFHGTVPPLRLPNIIWRFTPYSLLLILKKQCQNGYCPPFLESLPLVVLQESDNSDLLTIDTYFGVGEVRGHLIRRLLR